MNDEKRGRETLVNLPSSPDFHPSMTRKTQRRHDPCFSLALSASLSSAVGRQLSLHSTLLSSRKYNLYKQFSKSCLPFFRLPDSSTSSWLQLSHLFSTRTFRFPLHCFYSLRPFLVYYTNPFRHATDLSPLPPCIVALVNNLTHATRSGSRTFPPYLPDGAD